MTDNTHRRPSPLEQADDAKRARDLGGEIGTLISAGADLGRQPWLPLVPGDIVLMYLPADGRSPAYGQTFLAVDGDTDPDTGAMLRTVSETGGGLTSGVETVSFYEMWFEGSPDDLAVIRGGALVYGQVHPAT